MKNIKTIDIQAKEWFDKVNGNSYFAGIVVVNYGIEGEESIKMPFQYGYGDAYISEGIRVLFDKGIIKDLFSVYELKGLGIIVRCNIERKCLKRELKQYD
jgi:hypothetical protein